ncbi:hypothetical protein LDENG_00099440, partial [Lucifuga dentata]
PRKNGKTKPDIVIRLISRKQKTDLITQGKKLKGTNVYLNEHLTRKNAEIAREARILKKQTKIQATWTWNCRVWIRLNGIPEQAKAIVINDLKDLDQYR